MFLLMYLYGTYSCISNMTSKIVTIPKAPCWSNEQLPYIPQLRYIPKDA